MNASGILDLLGKAVSDADVQDLFKALGTDRRPALDHDEEDIYHDWLLFRRQGLELGFTDSAYHKGAHRPARGRGELLLTQAYFYSSLEGGQPYRDELPFGLRFSDVRNAVRTKLLAYEESRHSYRSDTWDVGTFRLTIAYGTEARIDRLACRVMPVAISCDKPTANLPNIGSIAAAFGESLTSRLFVTAWGEALDDDAREQARTDGEIDLNASCGATLGFVGDRDPVFRSVVLHRSRDQESAGWPGSLPNGLSFEDSPEALFLKMGEPDVKGPDSLLTGYAVWHLPAYSVHALYSNVDNRVLRVKLLAPGTWKSVTDV